MAEQSLSEIYMRAADWLETHEWCQGELGFDEVGYKVPNTFLLGENAVKCCAAGSLFVVADCTEAWAAWNALEKFCDNSVARWNDKPGRTKAEVIAKLREAAKAVAS